MKINFLVLVFTSLIFTAGCVLVATENKTEETNVVSDNAGLSVIDGWVRAVPPISKHTAAYFTLQNESKTDRILKQVSSPIASVAEIHEVYEENGLSGMRPINGLTVPANGSVVLKPAGYHVMLINIKQPIKEGDSANLTLEFTDGSSVFTQLPVRFSQSADDSGHDDHSHHHHHHH